MPGRPKSRARKESGFAETLAADLMARDPEPSSFPVVGPIPGAGSVQGAPVKTDGEMLRSWWRTQYAAIEQSSAERAQLLAGAGPHPSPVFAHQARTFGAFGIPRDVVAKLLGLSEGELGMYYGHDYEVGSAEMIVPVAQNLLRIATSLNDRVAVKAAIEVLNRRGGEEWRAPAQKLEVTDDRKKGNVIDSSKLTWEERQQLRAIVERAVGNRAVGVAGEIESDGE